MVQDVVCLDDILIAIVIVSSLALSLFLGEVVRLELQKTSNLVEDGKT